MIGVGQFSVSIQLRSFGRDVRESHQLSYPLHADDWKMFLFFEDFSVLGGSFAGRFFGQLRLLLIWLPHDTVSYIEGCVGTLLS